MTHFECFIPLVPAPKQRPRFWNGRAVTPGATRKYEHDVSVVLRKTLGTAAPMLGKLLVEVIFQFKRPKRPTNSYPSRIDLDNLIKAVTDAANGIVWKDDVQIARMEAEKIYNDSPGTWLVVTELT